MLLWSNILNVFANIATIRFRNIMLKTITTRIMRNLPNSAIFLSFSWSKIEKSKLPNDASVMVRHDSSIPENS